MTTLQYINYLLFKGRMVCANWWERTPTTLRPSSQGPQINLHQQSSTSLVEVIPTVSISLSKEKATNKVCARLHVALHSSLVPFHFMIWFVLRVKPVASCLNIEYTVPSLLHFGVFFFFYSRTGDAQQYKDVMIQTCKLEVHQYVRTKPIIKLTTIKSPEDLHENYTKTSH